MLDPEPWSIMAYNTTTGDYVLRRGVCDSHVYDLNLVQKEFETHVRESLALSADRRRERLAVAPKLPIRIQIQSFGFQHSPDVVAEVLSRAKGACESCGQPAPFIRISDGSPYLEVHHKIQLARGGEDTVENAIAICPNCHRQQHYG